MEKKQKNSRQDEKKVKKQPVKKQKQTEEKPVEKKSAVKTKQEVKTTEEKTKPEVKTEKSRPTKTEMPKKKKSGLFKAAMATFAVAAAVALSIFGITELTKVSPEKAVSEITQNGEIRYGKVNELVLSFDKNVSFDKDGDVVWILDGSEVQRGSVKNGDSFVLKHELGSVGLHDVRVEVCDYQNLTAEKRVEVLKPLLTVKASDAVKIYGQKNPVVKYSVSGFVDGDGMDAVSQTVNPVFDADETSGVGEYCIKKDFSDEKYDVTVESGKLTVLPRPVAAKADAVSKVYDGTADAGSVNLRAEGLINGDVVTLTYATASFADKNVKAVFTIIGGANSNQLLKYLDYDLIRQNPKVFCGFSDITALENAILAKTGMITYYGPHFSSLGMKKGCDYTFEHFIKMLVEEGKDDIAPSQIWSDDLWFLDQEKREFEANEGYWNIHGGTAEGTIIGGNLCTFNLLLGTSFRPKFVKDTILFIEDTESSSLADFERNLQALIYQEDFVNVKGIVIGRFQKGSKVTREGLEFILNTKAELKDIPILANVDFGHSAPLLTIPLGGQAKLANGHLSYGN